MKEILHLSFNPDANFVSNNAEIIVESPTGIVEIKNARPGVRRAFKLLSRVTTAETRLVDTIAKRDGRGGIAEFYYVVRKLKSIGALCYVIQDKKETHVTFLPISSGCSSPEVTVLPAKPFLLSRFAYIHREEEQIKLQSPLAFWTVLVQSEQAILLLLECRSPKTMEQLQKRFSRLGKSTIEIIVRLLVQEGFLEVTGKQKSELLQWEFHDLLFHSQSRLGRSQAPCGGTYRFKNAIKPPSPLKDVLSGERTRLFQPNIEALRKSDQPFSAVLESRQSIRIQDQDNPINVEQLGEFLYRVARIRKIYRANMNNRLSYDITSRPYPGAGACYELELYAAINFCKGLVSGFYYYDARVHHLCKLSDVSPAVDQLLTDARNASGESIPQVLICIAARFARVSWKYQGMGYAAILKDVGVLYQTMYLVATAMGLAPCALGAGNSDLFTQCARTNYYSESSVGEFMLGSKRRE